MDTQAHESSARPPGISRGRQVLVLAVLLAIVLVAVGYQVYRSIPRARVAQVDNALVTAVNVEQRTAEIEFTHPRSGRTIRVKGTLAPDGQLLVNDEPAPLSALRVGDRVSVRGTLYPNYTVTAEWVRVTTPAAAIPNESATAPTEP